MKKHCLSWLVLLFFIPLALHAQTGDELDDYIKYLKDDHAGPLKVTGFLTPGSDFLYGYDYYVAKNYSSAEWYFKDVLKKQQDNAFAHYLLGVSLLRQNDPQKAKLAKEHLDKAYAIKPSLKERFQKDVTATANTGVQAGSSSTHTQAGTGNTNSSANYGNSLDAYINRLKASYAVGGAETAMFSAGQEALYGFDYYEKFEYASAASRFALSLATDANNPYVNYMMAVSLAAQGQPEKAKPYIAKAVAADAALAKQYVKDVAEGKVKWKAIQDKKIIKTTPAKKPVYGGALKICDYTCSQSVWNGPNASPAYRHEYKGYFALKADGTYRWLNNGGTGKYTYDAKTGKITWLSGHFKTTGAKTTLYRNEDGTPQISVIFSDTYRLECGCKK